MVGGPGQPPALLLLVRGETASSNSQFTASPTSSNLSAGASQKVTVTFTPTKVGWEQGVLAISHNVAGNPSAVTASGIGRVNPPTGSLAFTKIAFQSDCAGNYKIFTIKTLSIVFSPRSSGTKNGVLNIAHDKGTPLTISLSGTATAVAANPLRVVPTALSFDNTQVGAPATKTLRLVNSGNSILSLKLETSGTNRTLFRLSRT